MSCNGLLPLPLFALEQFPLDSLHDAHRHGDHQATSRGEVTACVGVQVNVRSSAAFTSPVCVEVSPQYKMALSNMAEMTCRFIIMSMFCHTRDREAESCCLCIAPSEMKGEPS